MPAAAAVVQYELFLFCAIQADIDGNGFPVFGAVQQSHVPADVGSNRNIIEGEPVSPVPRG